MFWHCWISRSVIVNSAHSDWVTAKSTCSNGGGGAKGTGINWGYLSYGSDGPECRCPPVSGNALADGCVDHKCSYVSVSATRSRTKRTRCKDQVFAVVVCLSYLDTVLLHTSMLPHNTPQLPATNRVKQNSTRCAIQLRYTQ